MTAYQIIIIVILAVSTVANIIFKILQERKINNLTFEEDDKCLMTTTTSQENDAERLEENDAERLEENDAERHDRAQKVQAQKELKSESVKHPDYMNDCAKKSHNLTDAEKLTPNVDAKKIIKDLKKSNQAGE